MQAQFFRLDGHKPVPCTMLEWAEYIDSDDRIMAVEEHDGIRVSTVFLGLNHNHSSKGPPWLFETMIFGGKHKDSQWRYETWDEAMKGQLNACALAFTPSNP